MRLTITWELPEGTSTEAAAALAQRWAAGQIGGDGRLPRPACIKIEGPAPTEPLPNDAPGRQLAERRQALGLTQRELARRAQVSQNTVSLVERGMCAPNSQAEQSVRRALNAEVAR